MAVHVLKMEKQWADAKLAGLKPFEVRLDDRGFQKGDGVSYAVVDPKTHERWVSDKDFSRHPLEQCEFTVTYVQKGVPGVAPGYCVFADAPVTRPPWNISAPAGNKENTAGAYAPDRERKENHVQDRD